MSTSYHPKDVALARTRVALAELAPEIPENEIIYSADLRTDLYLDELTVWALAANLEKLAKVQIADADIAAARTVNDLCELAISDVPFTDAPPAAASSPASAPASESAMLAAYSSEEDDEPADVMAAAADLAKLFNN